ncbi:MAG: tetratricopeptide repeat protein [Nitrospinota bacterium]|nr:tetratricopeptide repeat protein [Nitrospinota bacterium]
MARYDRIAKKKSERDRLLGDPSSQSMEWLDKHGLQIGVLAAVLFVTALVLLGLGYYKRVTLEDAQNKLYTAATQERMAAAGAAPVKSAIDEYESLIATASDNNIETQARLLVAGLYMENGDPVKAAEHYSQAAKSAGPGTMFGEFSQAGLALALAAQGKSEEAQSKLLDLSKNAIFYPKSEALMELAFVQAEAGKNEQAGATLAGLKDNSAGAIPTAPVEDTIGRMKRGEISSGLKRLYEEMEKAQKRREQEALEKALAAPPPSDSSALPVAPGAVHGGGASNPQ